jgi:uncharacterized RDD family membrane protein YckC
MLDGEVKILYPSIDDHIRSCSSSCETHRGLLGAWRCVAEGAGHQIAQLRADLADRLLKDSEVLLESQPQLTLNPDGPRAVEIDLATLAAKAESLARPATRFKARLLDSLLVAPILIAVGILTMLTYDNKYLSWTLPAATLPLLVYQWFLIATTGKSLGKRWCRIKIVRTDGRPVGLVSGVLLREWIPMAIGFIPWIGTPVGLLDAAFILRANRRCLHDHIARTKVIDER